MNAKCAGLILLMLGLSQNARAGDLDWLIGCWETPDKSAMEAWVKDTDGGLAGFSVTLRGGQVSFYEVLRISRHDDGSMTYTAHPLGQETATFTATAVSESQVTFSNPSHDFPQQISYRREAENLFAHISAMNGKDPVAFNKRACE